jgi:hypothetical protein
LEIAPSKNVINGTKTTVRCISITNEVSISNFNLYRDSTLIGNDTLYSRKDEQTLDAGTYVYVCNSSATQNFTNQSINGTLVVSLVQNITPTLNLIGPSIIQIEQGKNATSSFYLENNLGYALSNLFLALDNINSNWYSIGEIPSTIPNNFSLLLKVNFTIPSDATQGNYSITLRSGGKSPSNESKVTTKSVTLTVAAPQQQNFPPVYSPETANTTVNGTTYEFALKWTDDKGLSGYIFSSNITGEWINDSWTPLTGTDGWSYAYKNITIKPGAVINWKFYMNDSNNLWSESQEFSLEIPKAGFDFLPIVILIVFVVALASLILFISHRRSKKAPKKEEVTYVYNKKDIK